MVKGLQRVGDTAWLSRNGFIDDEATEICKIEEICRQIPKTSRMGSLVRDGAHAAPSVPPSKNLLCPSMLPTVTSPVDYPVWTTECLPKARMDNHAMRTLQLSQYRNPPETALDERDKYGADWSIGMEVDVNADARRIAEALTVPEYMEAWLRAPGRYPGSSVSVYQTFEAFRSNGHYSINYHTAGKLNVRITCSYLVRRRHKILLAWHEEDASGGRESLVDIRIRGNFGSSIVVLHHKGFVSQEEYRWHKEMWSTSLDRLASLMHLSSKTLYSSATTRTRRQGAIHHYSFE